MLATSDVQAKKGRCPEQRCLQPNGGGPVADIRTGKGVAREVVVAGEKLARGRDELRWNTGGGRRPRLDGARDLGHLRLELFGAAFHCDELCGVTVAASGVEFLAHASEARMRLAGAPRLGRCRPRLGAFQRVVQTLQALSDEI